MSWRSGSDQSELSFFPQSLSDAMTADVQSSASRHSKLEAQLNSGEWTTLEENNRNIPVQFHRLGTKEEHQKADVSQTRQSAPAFHESPKWTCWLDNDKTLSSWFIFFFFFFSGATRNWLLVWQLSRSETLMMKAAKTLNVDKDEVLHIPFCTKEMTVKLQTVAYVCDDWRCQ